ncbi:YceI family protein [Ideonella sp.]|uniref:YceI family protein n=1 Tax=Ideonella sp. TaxID=1929293 RepID=UPI0035B062FC
MTLPPPLADLLRAAAASGLLGVFAGGAGAAPVSYEIDPTHTYPSFEADHLGGLSVWRGKFNKTAGKIVMDKAAGNGAVDLFVEMDSVDFGLPQMNAVAKGQDLFDVEHFPHARFRGQLEEFTNGAPGKVVGELTLHGVTKPLTLEIRQFKCMPHPLFKRELCGADAHAVFQRDAFGLDSGKAYGFRMDVTLRIQVEALATE